jgi:hypothetical protein
MAAASRQSAVPCSDDRYRRITSAPGLPVPVPEQVHQDFPEDQWGLESAMAQARQEPAFDAQNGNLSRA